jgi:hypothetical protein
MTSEGSERKTGTGSPADVFAGTSLQQLVTVIGGGSARDDTTPHATDITFRGVRFAE